MSTAIIVIIIVFAFVVGGMITLLKSANQKFPDTYDKSKTGFDDEEDDWGTDSKEKQRPDDSDAR